MIKQVELFLVTSKPMPSRQVLYYDFELREYDITCQFYRSEEAFYETYGKHNTSRKFIQFLDDPEGE